jgi:hypothetical protein
LLLTTPRVAKKHWKKHISDNVALGSYEDKKDESATSSFPNTSSNPSHLVPASKGPTPKSLTKKELQKLRQQSKKRLVKMQHKESDDITDGDDNLNNSVEDLINPHLTQMTTVRKT